MDLAVVWSPTAARDLEDIADYIAKDSQTYAASFVTKVLRVAGQLSHFPDSGRVIPELNISTIRERFISHYRLIYQHREHDVLILALIHGNRLLPDSIAPTSRTD